MIGTFLSHPLFLAALLSFLVGLFGTIVAFFWIRPIWRYRKLRRQTLNLVNSWGRAGSAGKGGNRRQRALEGRKLSVALTETYNELLPPWYRMVLARRRESPLDAARHLLVLADIRNPDHAEKRVRKVRAALELGDVYRHL